MRVFPQAVCALCRLIYKSGFKDLELLWSCGNISNFETSIAICQRAGGSIAVDPHQRTWQPFARGTIAHNAMDRGRRPFGSSRCGDLNLFLLLL